MLGTMLVAIDNTIIGVAVPNITTEFKSLNGIGWYSSAYLIAVTALQPTYGKAYKCFNVKLIYLSAIVVFEAASHPSMFIIGRAVAGIGAGAIFQGALGIINLVTPLPRRPLYFSIVVSVFALAVCIGPVLGGVITDRVTWRWCFWIAVAVQIGATIFVNSIFHDAPIETPDIPPQTIIAAGSIHLDSLAPEKTVLVALHTLYSKAVAHTLFLALATAVAALPFAAFMEWKESRKQSEVAQQDADTTASQADLEPLALSTVRTKPGSVAQAD
ncbi:MAG: hypothetical protein LQ350_007764 [Teloschistes chrysophthalmus]|nr:MAG: hypothetical protein LQ350_007764 [Niorma chrysophthalma]